MKTFEPSSIRKLLTLGAALVALLLPSAAGAAETPDDFDPFGEVVDVRLINVEVVVTDRQGNRVHGLPAGDFRLLVDGEEVALDFFTEVRDRRAVETASETPAAPAGETVGTSYLVYVDDYFPLERDRNRVLDQLAAQVGELAPADRMAIVAYDDRQLELISGWTSSADELRAAFERAGQRPAYGLRYLAELRNHDRTLALSADARSGDPLLTLGVEDRFFASEVARKVERSVAAASASLRGFASAPGRKVLLLLAGGWPYSPVEYVAANRAVLPTGGVPSGETILRPLVDAANRLGYTIYPVDLPGLSRAAGADVERGGLIDPLTRDADARFDEFSSAAFSDREGANEDTLRHLARETGGQPLINARRLSALPQVSADVGEYYWLGFTPPGAADDRRHRVRVVVDRPGLRVRARQSYFDLTPAAERTMAVEGALLFGGVRGMGAAAGGLIAELGAAERDGRRFEVPLVVYIPTDMLTAVPDGDEWLAKVEVRVGSRDGRGRISDVATAPVELRFPEDPKPGRQVTFRSSVRLRDADQTLIVQVTDPVAGVTRTTEAAFQR